LDTSILPTKFSEWDEGDAYTMAEIGTLPSQKVVFGAIVLEGVQVSDFSIVIRLHKRPGNAKSNAYRSPEGTEYEATAERVKDQVSESIAVRVEDIAKNLSARRHGLLETDLLKDRSVLIVGLGTGGITVALELAKAGVGRFVLVDRDRLEIGNVARHSAGISFVGRRKVAAARDLIRETDPSAVVEVHAVHADEESEELLRSLIGSCDLVVCATDNRPSKLFINALCVDMRKNVIFGGAFRRAYGGQVLRVRPHQSACYHCFVLSMPEREADREISSQEDADSIAYSDRPVSIEPGLSMDVAPIANMVSKLALQELLAGKESTLHMLDRDFEAGWYFWINRPEPKTDYASLPPLCESSDDITILRWYGVHFEKEPGCPTCGDFEGVIRKKYGVESGTGPLPTQSGSSGI
jgi:molybdopterin/thiamine biosynthesis adenylyltransferase